MDSSLISHTAVNLKQPSIKSKFSFHILSCQQFVFSQSPSSMKTCTVCITWDSIGRTFYSPIKIHLQYRFFLLVLHEKKYSHSLCHRFHQTARLLDLHLFHLQREENKIKGQGINFLVSHRNLLCIFYMTAIQVIFCVAVFLHRSVQNLV